MSNPLTSIALSRAETFQDLLDAETAGLAEHKSIVFVFESGRFAKYAWDGAQWSRVAGKFSSISPTCGFNMSTGVLAFNPTTVEINLGPNPTDSGSFNIPGFTGLTPGEPAKVWQLPGPYTGKGNLADECEMDAISVSGYAFDAATIRCYWTAYPGPVSGNFTFGFQI